MTGIQLPGLATGLDTTTLIQSLMDVEAQPQTLLKNKVTAENTKITDFQSLNTKIAALATLAKTNSTATSLNIFKSTTSDPSVTATTTNATAAGSIDITVDKLAQAQTTVTAAMTAWPQNPPQLTFVNSATGAATQVSPASTNLDDVVKAINSSAAGVTATKVAAGKDGSGNTQYRLQLVSSTTGAAGAFTAYQGTPADVTGGSATDLLTAPGAATIKTAQDASARLWAGTPAEQVITSSTNTFASVLPGVDITASAVSATPVSVNVSQDTSAAGQQAAALVASISQIISLIQTGSAATTTTDATTNASTTVLGSYTGDSTIRDATDQITSAATDPVNGFSPSDIGISIQKDGTIQFDIDKFMSSLASDPTKTQTMFTTIATRLQTAATTVSDPYTGTLTSKITNSQSEVRDLNDQVTDWDRRLADRKTSLTATYSNLEVVISQLNSQSNYLSSQIAGLTGLSQSSTKK